MNIFTKPACAVLVLTLALIFGCNSQTVISTSPLSEQEKYLCDSLNIDTSIVLAVRTQTDSSVTPFPAHLDMLFNKDMDAGLNAQQAGGFIFKAPHSTADNIVSNLYNDFQKKGYTIFVLDRNFGISNKSDILGVLKTLDKYQILRQVQTDGINWDIDNDSLLNIVRGFDKNYSLDLFGASGDWCEFKINKEPQNWLTLAKEAYKVCPDLVDQGSGTVEKLAAEMQQTKRLYFWWD